MIDVGQIWPGWQLEELIGQGSYGKVYRIRREELGRIYYAALKCIEIPQSEDEIHSLMELGMDNFSIRSYFEQTARNITNEIQLMESLKSASNIVVIQDHYLEEHEAGIGWDILIRMELLESLNSHQRKYGPPDQNETVQIGINICSALDYCEQKHVIHRDVKPENIFLNEFGDYKLGDFGIAKQLEQTKSSYSQKGTSLYMAPEVNRGEKYNQTVDIYSLGLVLYKFLNRQRMPFMPTDRTQIYPSDISAAQERRLMGEALPAPADADPLLAKIVLKACDPVSANRYQHARDMENDLRAWADGSLQKTEEKRLKEEAERQAAERKREQERLEKLRKEQEEANRIAAEQRRQQWIRDQQAAEQKRLREEQIRLAEEKRKREESLRRKQMIRAMLPFLVGGAAIIVIVISLIVIIRSQRSEKKETSAYAAPASSTVSARDGTSDAASSGSGALSAGTASDPVTADVSMNLKISDIFLVGSMDTWNMAKLFTLEVSGREYDDIDPGAVTVQVEDNSTLSFELDESKNQIIFHPMKVGTTRIRFAYNDGNGLSAETTQTVSVLDQPDPSNGWTIDGADTLEIPAYGTARWETTFYGPEGETFTGMCVTFDSDDVAFENWDFDDSGKKYFDFRSVSAEGEGTITIFIYRDLANGGKEALAVGKTHFVITGR